MVHLQNALVTTHAQLCVMPQGAGPRTNQSRIFGLDCVAFARTFPRFATKRIWIWIPSSTRTYGSCQLYTSAATLDLGPCKSVP